MTAHAKKHSPSAAERWMTCPGSVAACLGLPDSSSKYADEGTAAHELAEKILLGADGASLVGQLAENGVEFTHSMLVEVTKYVSYVQDLVTATGGTLLVEQRLPLLAITGEEAHGTSDAVIIAGDELIIVDLKFGMGVRVDAQANPQLSIYAAAGLEQYAIAADFQRIRTVIVQPRLDHVSESVQTLDELVAFVVEVKAAVAAAEAPNAPLVPSTKGCKFCKAKANCKALRDEAISAFDNVAEPATAAADELATAMAKVEMIEGWLKSVRAEVERRLLSGAPVPGYKLVQGKRGHRKWSNPAEAEATLKTMRVPHDRMYDYSLVSPTTVEKLFKEGIVGPRQWPSLQPLISQSEGGPSVAPESDKRAAMLVTSASAFDFDDVTNNPSFS